MDDVNRAEYDWATTTPSTAVVETVAIASDREPTAIEPLYETIDPDALDALVRSNETVSSRGDVNVTFEFAGLGVAVHGDGGVVVRPP